MDVIDITNYCTLCVGMFHVLDERKYGKLMCGLYIFNEALSVMLCSKCHSMRLSGDMINYEFSL